jgi:hypothetical protein
MELWFKNNRGSEMKINLRKLALAAGTAFIALSAQGALAQSVTMAVAAPVTSLDPH